MGLAACGGPLTPLDAGIDLSTAPFGGFFGVSREGSSLTGFAFFTSPSVDIEVVGVDASGSCYPGAAYVFRSKWTGQPPSAHAVSSVRVVSPDGGSLAMNPVALPNGTAHVLDASVDVEGAWQGLWGSGSETTGLVPVPLEFPDVPLESGTAVRLEVESPLSLALGGRPGTHVLLQFSSSDAGAAPLNCVVREADGGVHLPGSALLALNPRYDRLTVSRVARGLGGFAGVGDLYAVMGLAATNVVARLDYVPKRVFVSSDLYPGNLGGVAGADALCNAAAARATLGGRWSAYLATASASAVARIRGSGPWYVNGTASLFAQSKQQFFESGFPRAAIDQTESRERVTSPFETWTGGRTTEPSMRTCLDWTSTAITEVGGTGVVSSGSVEWSVGQLAAPCASLRRLYCFED